MASHNTVDPQSAIGRPSPVMNQYAVGTTDSTAATATLPDVPAVADKQHAVYGFVVSNTGSAVGRFTIGSANTQILSVDVPAGGTVSVLAPDGLGPLCITETNRVLRLFNVKVGAGTTMATSVIYRTV